MPSLTGGYPGFLAPASLKQRPVQRLRRPHGGYPGFLAPASLKRLLQNHTEVNPLVPYPGFLAPASLKLEPHGELDPGAPHLSGVSCPGLIKA